MSHTGSLVCQRGLLTERQPRDPPETEWIFPNVGSFRLGGGIRVSLYASGEGSLTFCRVKLLYKAHPFYVKFEKLNNSRHRRWKVGGGPGGGPWGSVICPR